MAAVRDKLAAAEQKYGYRDGWLSPNWMSECRAKMYHHITKGDPLDVIAYCLFLWHHGAPTCRLGFHVELLDQFDVVLDRRDLFDFARNAIEHALREPRYDGAGMESAWYLEESTRRTEEFVEKFANRVPPVDETADAAKPSRGSASEVLDTACVTRHIDPSGTPYEALNRIIDWEVNVALDPRVSAQARTLMENGRVNVPDLVRSLFVKNPDGEPGPTDEPESQYRDGYNTALEDVLATLESPAAASMARAAYAREYVCDCRAGECTEHLGDRCRAVEKEPSGEREATIAEVLCELDGMIKRGEIDEPAHSERNGIVMAFNAIARLAENASTPTFVAKHVSLKQKGGKIELTLEVDGIEGAPRYALTPINPAVVRVGGEYADR